MGPFASERGYARRCGASFKPLLAGFEPQNAPKSAKNCPPGRPSQWPARDARKRPSLWRVFRSNFRGFLHHNAPKCHRNATKSVAERATSRLSLHKSLCTPVCTIDGTLCERARVYPSLRRVFQATSGGFWTPKCFKKYQKNAPRNGQPGMLKRAGRCGACFEAI
eukprot:gene9234-biopygen22698